MALAASNLKKQLVIHWEDFDRNLPHGSDSQSKLRRRELFEEFDPNGNGILSQAHIVRSIYRLFPRVVGIVDTRPLLNLCFRVARNTSQPIVPISVANADRNQFRVMLIVLRCYFKAWEVWYNHTSAMPGHDGLIRLEDIDIFRTLFEEWKVDNLDMMVLRLRRDFNSLDVGKVGALQFDKFADSCLRRTTPMLSQEDEDAEQEEAKRLLKQTHAHLFVEDAPTPSPKVIGGVTRTLGMRPKLGKAAPSRLNMNSSAGFDGSVTRYMKDQGTGWSAQVHSQYKHDYASPAYTLAKNAANMAKSPSSPSFIKRTVRQVGSSKLHEAGHETRYNLSRFLLNRSSTEPSIPPTRTAIGALQQNYARSSLIPVGGTRNA